VPDQPIGVEDGGQHDRELDVHHGG
jgi:hypothetical protein